MPEQPTRQDADALIHDTVRVRQGPALLVGTLIGVLFVTAVVIAVVQNDDSVRVEWTAIDVDAPLWLLLVGAMAVGALLCVLAQALIRRAIDHNSRRHAAAEELGRRRRRPRDRTPA